VYARDGTFGADPSICIYLPIESQGAWQMDERRKIMRNALQIPDDSPARRLTCGRRICKRRRPCISSRFWSDRTSRRVGRIFALS
jgi:hypothetical protein